MAHYIDWDSAERLFWLGYRPCRYEMPSEDIPAGKAEKILEDGKIHGKKLTEKQRKMFGAAADKYEEDEGEEAEEPEQYEIDSGMPTQPPSQPESVAAYSEEGDSAFFNGSQPKPKMSLAEGKTKLPKTPLKVNF